MKDNNMDNLDLDTVLNEAKSLLYHANNLKDELDRMKDDEDFLINEYKTNKKWFRENPGKVTIEDVIKTCYELGNDIVADKMIIYRKTYERKWNK